MRTLQSPVKTHGVLEVSAPRIPALSQQRPPRPPPRGPLVLTVNPPSLLTTCSPRPHPASIQSPLSLSTPWSLATLPHMSARKASLGSCYRLHWSLELGRGKQLCPEAGVCKWDSSDADSDPKSRALSQEEFFSDTTSSTCGRVCSEEHSSTVWWLCEPGRLSSSFRFLVCHVGVKHTSLLPQGKNRVGSSAQGFGTQ